MFQYTTLIIDRFKKLLTVNSELVVFFFFLTTSLFLGDGKQPFVDAWWALGILMMYGVRYYQRGKFDLQALPHPAGLLWATLILYYVVLVPFSDSAGYSVTATIRLIEAYLVYLLFYTISSGWVITLFTKGLLFVGVVATLASFVFLLSPSLAGFLPPMNLLYAAYGHNHLADLLLFTIPIAIGMVERKRSVVTVGVLVLFLVGMALTLARGAWIILIGYLLVVFLRKKDTRVKIIALVGAAVLAVALLLLLTVSVNKTTAGMFQKVPQISRLLQKQSFLEDGRWEYWRQAIEAIKERPLFGSGPGTFYLESKRLQARPSSYSWFAHSFPFETTVEVGVVGATLLLLVFIASLRHARASPLFIPLCLALLYGFFEFNLNYISAWVLVWVLVGVLVGESSKPSVAKGKNYLLMLSIALLTCFYLVSISGELSGFSPKFNREMSPLSSWQATKALTLLDTTTDVSSREISIIEFFHKKDPEVLIALAKSLEQDRPTQLKQPYARAVAVDPQNVAIFLDAITFNLRRNDTQAIGVLITGISKRLLPKESLSVLSQVDFSDAQILPLYTKALFEDVGRPTTTREFLAKTYYFLGLSPINKDPKRTKALWTLARDSAPDWGYFHVELASLEYHILRNKEGANGVLIYCKKFAFAAQQCSNAEIEDTNPGDTYEYVKAIPAFR